MNLVRHQVVQFEHVGLAYHHRVMERFAGQAVIKGTLPSHGAVLAVTDPGETVHLLGFGHVIPDGFFTDPVEHRGSHLEAKGPGSDAEVGFKHLPHIHSGRHAQGVQNDIHRSTVREEGHILFRDDFGNDAFVAVATGHLVTHAELALGGDIYFNFLQSAGFGFVPGFHLIQPVFPFVIQFRKAAFKRSDDFQNLVANRAGFDFDVVVNQGQFTQQGLGDFPVGRDDDFTGLFIDDVQRDFFTQKNIGELLGQLVNELLLLLFMFVVDFLELLFLFRAVYDEVAAVVAGACGRNAHIHHDAGAAGGDTE